MNYTSFINTILALFIMLAIGFLAGRTKIIDSPTSKKLSEILIKISQPALIISSLTSVKYSKETLELAALTFIFGFILHAFLALIAYLACIRVKNLNEQKIMKLLIIFGNTGFIGIPLLSSLIGDIGAFMASFMVSSFNILLWTLGIAILSKDRDDIKLTLRKTLINRGTVPSLIGFLIFVAPAFIPSFTLPAFASSAISSLASLCTPVSLMIIGALLSTRTPRQILGSPKIYYVCAFKLVIIPLAVCVITKLLGFSDVWIIFATAISAMPCATSTTMFAETYDITPSFAAQGAGTSTLFSVATMPMVMWIAQKIIEL